VSQPGLAVPPTQLAVHLNEYLHVQETLHTKNLLALAAAAANQLTQPVPLLMPVTGGGKKKVLKVNIKETHFILNTVGNTSEEIIII
jgi:hypothetical protein